MWGTAGQSQCPASHFRAMSESARGWLWLLLSGALVGCAAVPHTERAEEAGCEPEAASFEEVCQQEGSLLAVCAGRQCAAYRCREVAEHLQLGQVVRTRGPLRPPQPAPRTRAEVGTAWSGPQGLPRHVRPVLIIPWGNTSRPLLPPGQALEGQEPPRGKPYEKHHIYPQEELLKAWFERQGINIHEWTLALEVEEHQRIHRGAKGGPWNEAWRRFQKARPNATRLEMELHAGELIYEFNLYGVVLPYRRRLLRLPSNVLDLD